MIKSPGICWYITVLNRFYHLVRLYRFNQTIVSIFCFNHFKLVKMLPVFYYCDELILLDRLTSGLLLSIPGPLLQWPINAWQLI